MKEPFEYKGYFGSIELSLEDNLLFGKLLYIKDLISYSAGTPAELFDAFKHAVDDYLETCAELGDKPEQPFKGSLGIRLTPELHKDCALSAIRQNISLNEWIKLACMEKLASKNVDRVEKRFLKPDSKFAIGQNIVFKVIETKEAAFFSEDEVSTGYSSPLQKASAEAVH